ncbi:hypothetical protein DPPLL_02350 [Desulfofustis limnaeus]|uniref:Uncharacterized protein n=1 Tax=Desulfofustis limnaeus TaxID=2740163 RepID=A0ABM7W4N8_9BACT|nr:hypothetical protein DPPLL_02350 [Desulfofustis limnaeus]
MAPKDLQDIVLGGSYLQVNCQAGGEILTEEGEAKKSSHEQERGNEFTDFWQE